MPGVETAALFSKPNIPQAQKLILELIGWLRDRGVAARVDEQTAAYAGTHDGIARETLAEGAQVAIVLGGDGTLLAAARAVGGRQIPIFAVNLGSLGFLTTITLDRMYPELERVIHGDFETAPRRMLECALVREEQSIATYKALNDIVFAKASLARMIALDTYVDDHYVCRYKSDGLIVSTPTGSTAYSLSAGGPIVLPSVEAIGITPICPHMLTNRPVIVPGHSLIRVEALDDDGYLTVDGQVGGPLRRGDRILCRFSDTRVQLIRPPEMLFFDVLRAKLKWGER